MGLLGGTTPRLRLVLSKQLQRRGLHDVLSYGPSYKPTIGYGPAGRSADTGHVATVFGATGFLGRYLVHKLAKEGTTVVTPYREEDLKRHLKVSGDLGQVISLEWDIRDDEQTVECLRHSDIVYNLVGRDYETKNFSFADVNVKGAERIAKLATENGVPRLVHVSHLNASLDSPSAFYRTKAEGERKVREAFPNASIVKPSIMYGYEDNFLNGFARYPIWWNLNDAQTKIRPVHVLDVAQALHNFVDLPPQPFDYNLPGPNTYSYEQIFEMISSLTYNPRPTELTLPKPVAKFIARIAQYAWWPMVCPDEVERRFLDDSDVPGDWDKVGVEPDALELHAIKFLRQYRAPENYSRPVILPGERKPKEIFY
ncbi:hypothetical protein M422DRAFT_775527 [Sphaerobolus stellatus SS14]|nr:hypothetical protein M422DRAFT_775527 [Sphaerobolus stellatus SS14]